MITANSIAESQFTKEINKDESYEYCRKITKEYAKSFYFASTFLPADKRKATYALYGFCRYTDNLVDDNVGKDSQFVELELRKWAEEVYRGIKRGISQNPIIRAFIDVLKQYPINPDHAFELIEGVKMDITIDRYKTYEDLQLFCYRVASTVGLMMSEILGYSSKDALPYAVKLGEAMQITNILRDIREDYDEMGRVYIPQEYMEKFNYTEEDIKAHRVNDNFISLCEFLMQKAEKLYNESDKGIIMLEKDSRFSIESARIIYSAIIPKIRENNYDVFSQRASVSMAEKLYILTRSIVKSKLALR